MAVNDRQSEKKQAGNQELAEGPMTLSGLKHLIYAIPLDGPSDPMAVMPSIRWISQSLARDD